MDTSVASAFCKGSRKLPCTILCCTMDLHQKNMLTKLARTHILSQSFIHSIPDEKNTLATRCFGKLPNGTIWFYKVGTLGCSSFWKVSSTLRQSPKLLVARSLASVTDSVMVDAFEFFLYIPVKQMQDLLFPLCNYTSVFEFIMYYIFCSKGRLLHKM